MIGSMAGSTPEFHKMSPTGEDLGRMADGEESAFREEIKKAQKMLAGEMYAEQFFKDRVVLAGLSVEQNILIEHRVAEKTGLHTAVLAPGLQVLDGPGGHYLRPATPTEQHWNRHWRNYFAKTLFGLDLPKF